MCVLNVIFSTPAGKGQALEGSIARVTTRMIGFAICCMWISEDWTANVSFQKSLFCPCEDLEAFAHFFYLLE